MLIAVISRHSLSILSNQNTLRPRFDLITHSNRFAFLAQALRRLALTQGMVCHGRSAFLGYQNFVGPFMGNFLAVSFCCRWGKNILFTYTYFLGVCVCVCVCVCARARACVCVCLCVYHTSIQAFSEFWFCTPLIEPTNVCVRGVTMTKNCSYNHE